MIFPIKKKYRPPLCLLALTLLFAGCSSGSGALRGSGWTIDADGGRQVISVSHCSLGLVAEITGLTVREGRELKKLEGWKVRQGEGEIEVEAGDPAVSFSFRPTGDSLEVVSSSEAAVLLGTIPADKERFPARLIDPQGKPVAWKGTTEVKSSYGGPETKNSSYLPRENPEVLYLALGEVSARNLHALFDRPTDTALEFPEGTLLEGEGAPQGRRLLSLPLVDGPEVRLIQDYYTKTLGLPYYTDFRNQYFPAAPVVWNSWTWFYSEVTEKGIVENVDWIAKNLAGYAPLNVTIDDGAERGEKGEHYWTYNWDTKKFPHGGKWLAQYIKSKGLRAGLWVVPNAYAGAVKEHPEWYLRDTTGVMILDYNTPALDCTNPQVLDHLRSMFTTLKDWGFTYYKFDGEHALTAYVPSIDRSILYDPKKDPLEAYRNRARVIREAVGPETFIEACPAGTPLNGIGIWDAYFNGEDVYNSWTGMYAFFASLNANLFLNNVVSYLMPGEGICLAPEITIEKARGVINRQHYRVVTTRETGARTIGVNDAQARTVATFNVLSGAVYALADNLPDLPPDRVKMIKQTLPSLPVVPVDLFSRGSYMHWDLFEEFTLENYEHDFPRVMDLKVNCEAGVYDVVALTNWAPSDTEREVSFEGTLGLNPDKSYLVFDFWNQRLGGVFREGFKAGIKSYDTRVFIVRPAESRPQFITSDRHLTGAVGVERLAWDETAGSVSGTAHMMPDEDLSLFFHVPMDRSFAKFVADGKVLETRQEGELLKVRIAAKQGTVDWTCRFE
jgi:hypothetical protein